MLSVAFGQDVIRALVPQQQQASKPQDSASRKNAPSPADDAQSQDAGVTCEAGDTDETCQTEEPKTANPGENAQSDDAVSNPRNAKPEKDYTQFAPLKTDAQRVTTGAKPPKSAPQKKDNAAARDPNRPTGNARPNPYPDVPSLQELYRQVPSAETKLKRFGADLFVNGTGNTDSLPIDLPAGPDYVLGPGDGLSINLWGSVSQKINAVVDRGGRVALPESGAVMLAGLTLASAQDQIQKTLGAQYKNVRIDVSLTRLRTIRVYVVGDVERPGAYDISSLSTPLNALYIAGGPTAQGSLRTVRHYRQQKLIREVDLYELILRGVQSDLERIEQEIRSWCLRWGLRLLSPEWCGGLRFMNLEKRSNSARRWTWPGAFSWQLRYTKLTWSESRLMRSGFY
jgi:protein involved in polysaccharide export with SLBB domain